MLKLIEDALQQMIQSNEKNPSNLEGGAFCTSFESPKGVPWIQAKAGALNLYYPIDRAPDIVFKEKKLDSLPNMKFPSWKSGQFATISFTSIPTNEFARYIDKLFLELYQLPNGYIVNTETFDMR